GGRKKRGGEGRKRKEREGEKREGRERKTKRREESAIVGNKLISTLGVKAKAETYADQRNALSGADFVVVAFQIGGYG
ncbi:family 4 glycosyl hydrolase, partial [Rhizobium leguminosarum]|uniref:family 4 glycosyl hydrolase n=1 Tax=Rhizobium leguminosarum TaxID=384 RepID=UPI003F9BB60F